jgi:methionyl-tRNA formyltransferase
MKKINLAFFGTSEYAVIILEHLEKADLSPTLIITTPDKPAGKGLKLTPSPVKMWALRKNIPLLQPEKLNDEHFIHELKSKKCDLFVVVAYGKIIPQEVIDISPHGALNVHASLLPKLRGASPIESAILEDLKHTGVTIMLIDEKMDHGPILVQKEVIVEPWPPKASELGKALVETGGELLVKIIPQWINGEIKSQDQDEHQATYTKKFTKEDALIDLSADPYLNFRKIQAFGDALNPYFYIQKNSHDETSRKIRVIIKQARFSNGQLLIERVIPEGKKEMSYTDFLHSIS